VLGYAGTNQNQPLCATLVEALERFLAHGMSGRDLIYKLAPQQVP
jgi:hypothetical protein